MQILTTWVVIWLLGIPLFHIHPDAAHHHDESGPHNGGIVHTVFSRDLNGEFGYPKTHSQEPNGLFAHSGCPLQDSPELGFSLVSDKAEKKFFKSLLALVSVIAVAAALPSPEISDSAVRGEKPLHNLLFVQEHRSRAPPLLFL